MSVVVGAGDAIELARKATPKPIVRVLTDKSASATLNPVLEIHSGQLGRRGGRALARVELVSRFDDASVTALHVWESQSTFKCVPTALAPSKLAGMLGPRGQLVRELVEAVDNFAYAPVQVVNHAQENRRSIAFATRE